MPTRICYIIGQLNIAGAQKQLYELVRSIDKRLYEPVVVSLSQGGKWSREISKLGVEVIEIERKKSREVVRALRERKSWSQEHLANAAGLSVRTVQRVEMEGIASAETRLALAAALDVPVAELIPAPPSTGATVGDRRPPFAADSRFQAVGATVMRNTLLGLGVVIALAFALIVLWSVLSNFLPRS